MQMKLILLLLTLASATSAFAQTNNSNYLIDLTVPAGEQPVADITVFDESVSFVPNFAIDQKDPALSDLFGKNGSALCFPTSLAEALIQLQAYGHPAVALPIAGLSADQKSIEPNALVRNLAQACHTNTDTGTMPADGLRCLLALQTQAGLGAGHTTLIDPFDSDATLPIQTRDVKIADLRAALAAGHPVILEVGWFDFDQTTRTFKRDGGHYVSVYGYNYDSSWGEDQIQLKIINPLTSYNKNRVSRWDTITLNRVRPKAGITYPAHRPFTVSGSRFGFLNARGLVGEAFIVSPN
jgi:hypothetical protein